MLVIAITLIIMPFILFMGLHIKRFLHSYDEPLIVAWRGDKTTDIYEDELALVDIQLAQNYVVPDSFHRQNVVVIIVDAMRADHLPMYGYTRMTAPFLAQLYDTGKLIKGERTCATCTSSECGVSSLFFGKTWKNVKQKGFTLVSLLKKAGYETHFLLSGFSKDWSAIYDMFLPDVDNFQENPGYPLGDDRCIASAMATVPPYHGKPVFIYIHLMSAHIGGIQSSVFAKYLPVKPKIDLSLTYQNYVEMSNYHDNGILQADDMIRQVFDSLAHKQLLQNTQIWIVSDHGESIGEHGYTAHGTNLYEPVSRFPLLIYDDHDSTDFYQNTDFIRQIDIAPTIADRLGLPIPHTWNGRSMHIDSVYTYSYHQVANPREDKFSLIAYSDTAIYKLIFNQDFSSTELYDIKKDSFEKNNLAINASYSSIYEKMKKHAQASFEQEYIFIKK